MSGLYTALVLTALGTGTEMYANNQALKNKDAEAAAGIRRQMSLEDQAQTNVKQAIQKVGSNNTQNIQANQNAQQAAYLDALRRAVPSQSGALESTPGASARYASDVVNAQISNKAYGANRAAAMAATDAPQLTQQQDQLALGDTATKLGLLGDTSNNEGKLTQMRVNAIAPNPWLEATGQLLKGAGGGLASYSGYNSGKKKQAAPSGGNPYDSNDMTY
jgi:hypothetical protein